MVRVAGSPFVLLGVSPLPRGDIMALLTGKLSLKKPRGSHLISLSLQDTHRHHSGALGAQSREGSGKHPMFLDCLGI